MSAAPAPRVVLALTREAAAAAIAVSPNFFDGLVRSGAIRPAPLGGRKVVYSVRELERFLERRATAQRLAGKADA